MRRTRISKYRLLTFIYVMIIFIGVGKTYYDECIAVSALPVNDRCIVIDAGHGGFDPGKVASDGTEEKGINLAVAKALEGYLEQGGAVVYTTRTEDSSLSKNKREDLKSRADIANNGKADMFISIHQNSFPSGNARGAQVFYYKGSEQGKRLAELIQSRLKEVADNSNERAVKANDSYYVLKQTDIPGVIVECGFLSNSEEKERLLDKEYQEKLAWAIYMGVSDYFSEGKV